MSLHPHAVPDVPEETRQVAYAAFPKGNVYIQMRDELGTFYQDHDFVQFFPTRGQPAFSPWRLALITLMQFCENLTDRQAADAVRGRLDWKYALSLTLQDPGFHYSILSEFRQRLVENQAQDIVLNRLLDTFRQQGLLKARGRQRTDSTHVLGTIRTLNRLELVGETMRHALNTLANVSPEWVTSNIPADWAERYGHRFENYRLPAQKTERQQLALSMGIDALRLLYQLMDHSTLQSLDAIQTLQDVWRQHFTFKAGDVCWRDPDDLCPSRERIASPYDTEARYSRKRDTEWVGYKVHVTETCDDETPNLIVNIETTLATEQDIDAVEHIHAKIADNNLLPNQHLVDMAYVSSDVLASSHQQYQVDLLGPVRTDVSWQARTPNTFDITCFTIDWETRTVTCPMGHISRHWRQGLGKFDKPNITVAFDRVDCRNCSERARCTRSDKRGLTFPQEREYKALQAARQRQETETFKAEYRKRAGIEGTISQVVHPLQGRQTRYRGLAKSHFQCVAIAAAINVTRGVNWLAQKPKAQTKLSPFAALMARR